MKLKTNVFMSDMAEELFNAWQAVMEQPALRLFCSWHVDRAWRKNLSKVKGDNEKRAEVYKVIRTLMEESDKIAFEQMFQEAVSDLKSDPNTTEFAEYFCREYQRTVLSWAYCYRQNAGLNTNMHLERMHGVLKHIYLKGNKPKRLDIAIHALMRFLRDKLFEKLISSHRGKLTSKISAIRQRHTTSLTLAEQEATKSEEDSNLWTVCSKNKYEVYHVTRVNEKCNCELKCDECKICIHTYICTCPDSAIKFNMCKHIHLVQKLINDEADNMNVDNNVSEEGALFIHDSK